MTTKTPLTNRYEFVLFYDVEKGNPNGDPMPAICRVLIQKRGMAL